MGWRRRRDARAHVGLSSAADSRVDEALREPHTADALLGNFSPYWRVKSP